MWIGLDWTGLGCRREVAVGGEQGGYRWDDGVVGGLSWMAYVFKGEGEVVMMGSVDVCYKEGKGHGSGTCGMNGCGGLQRVATLVS